MRFASALTAGALCLAASLPVYAQTPQPDADKLALARQLVAKVEPNPQQLVRSVSGPMVGFMQQMGVHDPARAQALVQEAVVPVLLNHVDDLVDRSAQSYAAVLSVDDLKGVIAFYDTQAGQDLIKAQPQLAQLRVASMTAWMGTLQPEIVQRVQATMKAHGWDKAPQ